MAKKGWKKQQEARTQGRSRAETLNVKRFCFRIEQKVGEKRLEKAAGGKDTRTLQSGNVKR